jgi:hypothetical protein
MGRRVILLLTGCTLLGCGRQNAVYDKPFVDMDSLLNRHLHGLAAQKARLSKTAVVAGIREEKTWAPDSAGWAAELEIFRPLDDINRPGLHRQYSVTHQKDSLSNLMVVNYRAAGAPIRQLALYFLPRPRQLKKIEAQLQSANTLFTSRRSLKLEFDDWRGKPRLARYHVHGFQKMALGDSMAYQISGSVVY